MTQLEYMKPLSVQISPYSIQFVVQPFHCPSPFPTEVRRGRKDLVRQRTAEETKHEVVLRDLK